MTKKVGKIDLKLPNEMRVWQKKVGKADSSLPNGMNK